MVKFISTERICVGRIIGPHGVQGMVRVNSYTAKPLDIGSYGPVTDRTGNRNFELKAKRMVKKQVLACIKGVNNREAAKALQGLPIFIPRKALPETDKDEFYWEDLKGLSAETTKGKSLGKVFSIQEFGAGVMLEIGHNLNHTIFVPFSREVVTKVDLGTQCLVIDPPVGLLEATSENGGETG